MLTKQIISRPILNKILKDFSLGKIKTSEALPTSGNIAYVIRVFESKGQASYFLRLCPDGQRWRSRQEIAAEIELISHLKKRGLPVIPPLVTKKGEAIISWDNHFGYLRKYIPGEIKAKPTPAELFIWGKTLGSMHAAVKNYQTKNKRRHIFNLIETKKYFLQQKSDILKSNFLNNKNFVNILQQELFSLSFPGSLPKGTIHEDLGRRHVLWNNNKIIAIIDFDRCYYGYLIGDLGQAVRGWCFKNNWRSFDRTRFASLMEGYQTARKLTRAEKKSLPAAIKFAILERALSFCCRYVNFSHDRADQSFALDSLLRQLPLIEKNKDFIIKTLK